MIFVLTGPVHSGKTSSLQKWCASTKNIDGILCPENDNGKRFFIKVKSNESLALEVRNSMLKKQDEIIEVGSYKFLKNAFKQANEYLVQASNNHDFNYLIIDELGKLELKNKGLHIAAQDLIPNYVHNKRQHLILVVRESIIEEVMKHYDVLEYSILNKEDLLKLE